MPEERALSSPPPDDAGETEQQPGERHALVIGIDRYQDAQIRGIQEHVVTNKDLRR